ncbi:tyrosine-type recombinase/integrase [Blautia sp.]|uniref:tyrosine-type recombinase/integrase n=1 Tax=Blautia sp. TaxID=1955243 RepID=UPI003AB7B14A
MAKKKTRKKYPRLPSGFGTIRYLGSDRRNCYAVHPPATIDALGHVQRPPAICYTDDWIKGFTVLTAYKAGTYKPGMERELEISETSDTDILVQRIIADYSTIKGVEEKHPEIHEPTFEEVYEAFYKWKYEDPLKSFSVSSRTTTKAAYKNCAILHNQPFIRLKVDDLQNNLDNCPLKHASLEHILNLYHQMYKFAIMQEICEIDRSHYVSIKSADDKESGIPFTDAELKILWDNRNDEEVQMILIMCYSGFRITEYKTLKVNLKEKYFKGGIKTAAGINRIVPIHSSIFSFVEHRIQKFGKILPIAPHTYRQAHFYPTLEKLGLRFNLNHTPHDCRHTFSKLAERYGVSDNDRKRLLGHSFLGDITNGVYGHRDLKDLRAAIDKIQVPYL